MDDYGLLGLEELIIKNQGKFWNFKHEHGKLFLKLSHDSGEEEEWKEIGNDFYGGFSFAFDNENQINFIYKTAQEKVRYFAYNRQGGEDLYNIAIPEGEYIIFQKLLASGPEKRFILVVTEDVEKRHWKIYSSIKNDGAWKEVEIIDGGWGLGPEQVALAIGKERQIYLVYQKKNQEGYNIVYRVYKDDNWSEAFPVVDSSDFIFSPFIAVDKQGKPHLTWLRAVNSEIRVMYTCKNRVKNFWARWQWQKEQAISPAGVNCISPTIVIENSNPEIFWQVSEGINAKIFRYIFGEKKEPGLVATHPLKRNSSAVLDLDKIPHLNNYSGIGPGTTLFFLLLADEEKRQLTLSNVFPQEEKENSNDFDIKKELLKEKVESLSCQNTKLKEELIKKNQELFHARSEWEKKEKVLEKEIERLRQSLQAIQKANEELRQRLKERESQAAKEETEKNLKPPAELRKVYPFFPFIKK
ncbi:MAG: hypothetical protein GXW85_03360 [Clostridia bacterium]|nr:hypothetical protein [Clostridia bacterium]